MGLHCLKVSKRNRLFKLSSENFMFSFIKFDLKQKSLDGFLTTKRKVLTYWIILLTFNTDYF